MNKNVSIHQRFLSIDLTKKCTNNCIFCIVEGRNEIAKDQNIDDIKDFLSLYKDKGYTSVNLHGGEPTLYKELDNLIDIINELGYRHIVIQTNGVRLEDEQFVKNLIANNVKLFVVSMHDCIAEYHNKVTKSTNSFQRASNGIKSILQHNGEVRTNTVLLKSNYKRIGDIIDYLYGLGVRTFNISSLNPYWITLNRDSSLFDELAPSYKEMEPYLREMLDSYKDKEVSITLEGFPYCFLPEYNNFNLYNNIRDIVLLSDFNKSIIRYEEFLNQSKIRIKREECTNCFKNDVCKGVWSGYIKMQGWNEFNPVL